MGRLDWYYLLTYWLFDLRASSFLFIWPCTPDFLHQPCNKTSGNCGNVVCSTNGRVLCFSSYWADRSAQQCPEHSSAINRCNVVAPPRGPSWDWQSHPSSLRFPHPCYVMVLWIASSVGHHRSGQMIIRYYKSQNLFPLPAFDVSVICLVHNRRTLRMCIPITAWFIAILSSLSYRQGVSSVILASNPLVS